MLTFGGLFVWENIVQNLKLHLKFIFLKYLAIKSF